MKKQSRLNLFFLFFMFLFSFSFILNNTNLNQNSEDLKLNTKSEQLLLRYYQSSASQTCYVASGTYTSFAYSGASNSWVMDATNPQEGQVTHTQEIISTNILRRVRIVGFFTRFLNTINDITNIYIKWSNDSLTEIYNDQNASSGFQNYYDIWYEFPLDHEFKALVYHLKAVTAGVQLNLGITSERFYGYMPEISNILYSENIKAGEQSFFFADFANITSSSDQNITFSYGLTGNTMDIQMSKDWTSNTRYFASNNFSITGLYNFIITAMNAWNNYTLSSVYTFYVGNYPLYSYLSLFSNLDGFPLESKDFKVYLGEDEETSIVNFRDYHGNWTQLYTGSVNASLIDNYIKITAEENGLKTTLQDSATIDTKIYNTLLFDVKVENNTQIVIIYNPDVHEKDYYVNFYPNMTESWYTIEIPFFLFNQYNNITNDVLYKIGFWQKNSTMEISNIRAATHHEKTYLQQIEIQINMTSSELINELNNETYLNNSLLIFNSTKYVLNSSLNITEGYNCSGANWENVTIPSNTSITLNNSGHYQGVFSFYNDSLGSNPSGWTVSEGGTTSLQVIESEGNHSKIIEFYDPDASSYSYMNRDITSNPYGIIEGYIRITDASLTGAIGILATGGAANEFWFKTLSDKFYYYDGAWKDTGESATDNTWYHLSFIFESTAGGFHGLSENKWKVNVTAEGGATTTLGEYSMATGGNVGRIQMGSEIAHSGYYYYVDAFDYSTAINYYENRNRNLLDHDGYYVSDLIDFNKSYEITNISIGTTIPTNTTLAVHVSDNVTGSFDTWMNYSEYIGNTTQFIKYKILLNNTNSSTLPIFNNISFSLTEYIYNLSQTFNITYFNNSYASIWNSTHFINIKTNDSTGTNNISIYRFNETQYFNRSFNNTSYDLLNFTFDNNTIFDPDNNNTNIYRIHGESSNPFNISINLINCTTFYNQTLYSGEYNVSLLNNFENLYYYYFNNNSLNLDFCLYNGSHNFKQKDLDNSSTWEKYNQSVNATWTHLNFDYSNLENKSFWTREIFETKQVTYRLISPENRQNPSNLIFTGETRTLALQDYFNNTLYRKELDYTAFIDVALPFCTITLYNFYDEFLTVNISRGLGTTITLVIAPQTSVSLRVYSTSYQVHVRNEELQTLLYTEFSPESSKQATFTFGTRQSIDFETPSLLEMIIDFFFGTWYGWVLFALFSVLIAMVIYDTINNVKTLRKSKKTIKGIKKIVKNQNKGRRKEEIKDVKRKIKEATHKVRV